MNRPILMQVLPYTMFGALIGVAYLGLLGWNVRLYADRGAAWSAMIVHLMRLVVIGAAFTLCARQGALPLLSSLAGFQIVRTVAVNQRSRALERNS
jgi:F1F0 ATPase subunit 2